MQEFAWFNRLANCVPAVCTGGGRLHRGAMGMGTCTIFDPGSCK